MKKLLALALAVMMAMTLMTGIAAAQAGSVTVAVDDDSFTIGPWGNASAVRDWTETILWTHLCYRPFFGAALDLGELEMVAAKSVTQIDEETYEVEIFDNITDSLGNPIKASDVVFSYDKLAELGYVSAVSMYYGGAEVIDDTHVRITLKNNTECAIEEVLCKCSIASQAWYESATQDDIEGNPATTGPYKAAGIETGSSLTMAAREDYWKSENLATVELQNVQTIILRCITEASMRSIALENNEVDMAEIAATDAKRFKENADYNITEYQNAMSQYLIFNTSENSPFADVNLRKAVAYGFDSMFVLMGGGSDAGIISHDVAPNLGPDYVQEWDEESYFEYDPEKSAEYLAAAGYKPGEVEVHLMVSAQAPQGPYQAMQAMLQEVGINMVIDSYDRALRQTYQNDPTKWQFCEYSNFMADYTTRFWSDLFSEENYTYGTQGFTEDPELQRLLKAAVADRSEENMNAFHDYVVDQCYMVGLYTELRTIVTKAGLTDTAIRNLNPVLNAMTFTDDYVTAVK